MIITRALTIACLLLPIGTTALYGQQLPLTGFSNPNTEGAEYIDSTEAPMDSGAKHAGSVSQPLRVLFIGNSLIFVNDTPRLFSFIAANGLHRRVVVGLEALGGGTFEQFWNWDKVHNAIVNKKWDFVVLTAAAPFPQPGQSLDTNAVYPYVRNFEREVRAQHAQLIGIPTYKIPFLGPRLQGQIDTVVATLTRRGTKLAPVPEAWDAVQRTDSSINLYAPDFIHPSPDGSYLIALLLYRTMTQQSPLGLLHPAEISDHNAATLQKIAATAHQ
jgi:hypothetical protein